MIGACQGSVNRLSFFAYDATGGALVRPLFIDSPTLAC